MSSVFYSYNKQKRKIQLRSTDHTFMFTPHPPFFYPTLLPQLSNPTILLPQFSILLLGSRLYEQINDFLRNISSPQFWDCFVKIFVAIQNLPTSTNKNYDYRPKLRKFCFQDLKNFISVYIRHL